MAEKFVGNTSLQELQPAYEGDPIYGLRKVRRFEGPHDDIVAQSQLYLAAGFTVSVDPVAGSRSRLYVRTSNPQDPSAPPVDTWERVTELVQEDLRNNPRLILAAGNSAVTLNQWYKEAKDLIKTGGSVAYTDKNRQAFFELLSRGADAYLVRRIVLRRRRVFGSNIPAQSEVNEVESFYSTEALIQTFGVPAGIASVLPIAGPDTPLNTAWGWMERTDDSIVTPAYVQTEEVKDWVFAAWSTLLYNYVP